MKRSMRYVGLVVGVLVLAGLVITARHHWPKAITSDDIAIVGGALTLASTLLAALAAADSRSAARESHRALALHYQPGSVRVGFTTRNPDPNTPFRAGRLDGPQPLWARLTFWPDMPNECRVTWLDDAGREQHRQVTPTGLPDQPVLLEGITAHEIDTGVGHGPAAAVQRLSITCRDQRLGERWCAEERWPTAAALDSYQMDFMLID